MNSRPQLGSRGKPEESRRAILEAAIQEFAAEGVAGARTDAIARAAGVNKALLYYYFKDKEDLYGAVLDAVFATRVDELLAILRREASAGERVLCYVLRHFNFVAEHPQYPRLVQHEMLRAGAGKSHYLRHIVTRYFRPVIEGVERGLSEGIESGEFRAFDVGQMAVSITGATIYYFNSAPILEVMNSADPFTPAALAKRRTALLDLIAAAIFTDRKHGHELAMRIMKGDGGRRPVRHK